LIDDQGKITDTFYEHQQSPFSFSGHDTNFLALKKPINSIVPTKIPMNE
jgi:hypothetical protein